MGGGGRMRIGVVSDAHANLTALDAALRAMGPVDGLLFGGDLLGYYFDSVAVMDRLREAGAECILGNHDVYFLSQIGTPCASAEGVHVPAAAAYRERYGPSLERAARELDAERVGWLASLVPQRVLELGGARIMLTHGSPWRPVDEYVYPNWLDFSRFGSLGVDLVVMGHTHRPLM